jgi:hypothetical protein
MYSAALKERHGVETDTKHLSIPIRAETEMHGLLLVSTKKEFCSYINEQFSARNSNPAADNIIGVTKTYRCLVCIKNPPDIDRIEKLMNRDLTHWVNVKSPCPKKFVRSKPINTPNIDWQKCVMRITNVGDEKFRAACVASKYNDTNDSTLAHRLWGPQMERPAEDVSTYYIVVIENCSTFTQ